MTTTNEQHPALRLWTAWRIYHQAASWYFAATSEDSDYAKNPAANQARVDNLRTSMEAAERGVADAVLETMARVLPPVVVNVDHINVGAKDPARWIQDLDEQVRRRMARAEHTVIERDASPLPQWAKDGRALVETWSEDRKTLSYEPRAELTRLLNAAVEYAQGDHLSDNAAGRLLKAGLDFAAARAKGW